MSQRAALALALAASVTVAVGAEARAEPRERDVEIDRSAARDLYIRARPPAPRKPEIPEVLVTRLERAEALVAEKRAEAIALLRAFLDGGPTGEGRAEGLFKLAELLWEDARQRYFDDLLAHERTLERCRQEAGACESAPTEPSLDLREAETLYLTLLRDHRDFRRTDLVLYLAGFAAQQDQRQAMALERFAELIERFPRSSLVPDAWMMIGESSFASGEWGPARSAYERVLEHPDSGTYDLALFKSAWCDWQLGDSERAAERIRKVRASSRYLVSLGACATSGGLQALRNFNDDGAKGWTEAIYAQPAFIDSLDTATPVAEHVKVDLELWGCPVNARQVFQALRQLLFGVAPVVDKDKLCVECKRQQHVCVLVAKGEPCMGPVTHTGCGALCPAFGRDCYACFGPAENPNTAALARRFEGLGLMPEAVARRFHFINSHAPAFRSEWLAWKQGS